MTDVNREDIRKLKKAPQSMPDGRPVSGERHCVTFEQAGSS